MIGTGRSRPGEGQARAGRLRGVARCNGRECKHAQAYICFTPPPRFPAPPPPPGMKRAMLEVVVSGAVVEPTDVDRYIRCTLLAAMNDREVGM